MNHKNRALLLLALSMAIFGTVGILRTALPAESSFLAFFRGVCGMLVLLPAAVKERQKSPAALTKRTALLLLLSGGLMGANWVLLFEAYRFTSVSRATLCYYMAPVIVTLLSPAVLKEKLGAKQMICVAAAVAGMVPVSGVLQGERGKGDLTGVLLALGAAALYASVVLLNKKLADAPAKQRTAIQLGAAGLCVLPYALFTGGFPAAAPDAKTLLLLLTAGVVHTGLAYLAYFSAIPHVSAQTAAVFSYIDPVTAIVLSALLLHEKTDLWGALGAALILGATLASGLEFKNFKKYFKKTEKNA